MRQRWRAFQSFDEDTRESLEITEDMGLCPVWDRTCAHRVDNTWRASHQRLGPSFVIESLEAKSDVEEPELLQAITEYGYRRLCERALERTRSS